MGALATFVLGAGLLLAPGEGATAPKPSPAATADTGFQAASSARDIRRAGDDYAEDAILMAPEGEIVTGRERIRAFWKESEAKGLQAVTLRARRTSAEKGLGYEMGTFELRAAGGGKVTTVTGEYLSVFKRGTDGHWRVVYDVLNPLSR